MNLAITGVGVSTSQIPSPAIRFYILESGANNLGFLPYTKSAFALRFSRNHQLLHSL